MQPTATAKTRSAWSEYLRQGLHLVGGVPFFFGVGTPFWRYSETTRKKTRLCGSPETDEKDTPVLES